MTPTKAETFPWWRSGGGVRVHKVKSLTQMLMNRRVDGPELQRQSSLLAFHDVAYPSPIVAIPLHRRPIRPSTCCQHAKFGTRKPLSCVLVLSASLSKEG
ncbi:uncharacterized protein CCOS01_09145 [Colletotrichum costaricense]|uniref:Uncharacterized protein n=1 Tax=Colletotrichum costaricense TaxID=1209916 RepID=A0AAI9YTR9_9PEZI|nr:uncharacterized protein CCOS01_09145 [Colletotrichum costaricense]KAK1524058.1 hypothetical protein CCOS01_09145 [Colletotrichum costaricense]